MKSMRMIDGEWFEILHHFEWKDYSDHASAYYDALYAFNTAKREASKEAREAYQKNERK